MAAETVLNYLDVETIKTALRIDEGSDEEPELIQMLLAAADSLEAVLNRTIEDLVEANAGVLPWASKQWLLLAVGEFHSRRSLNTTSAAHINEFYQRLIDKYITYS